MNALEQHIEQQRAQAIARQLATQICEILRPCIADRAMRDAIDELTAAISREGIALVRREYTERYATMRAALQLIAEGLPDNMRRVAEEALPRG